MPTGLGQQAAAGHRAVWKIVDNNSQTFDMYGTHGHGGKEMKMMEIVYTRKP